jgi:hypothetical protein
VVQPLFASNVDIRKEFVELFLKVFDMSCIQEGNEVFSVAINNQLIDGKFGLLTSLNFASFPKTMMDVGYNESQTSVANIDNMQGNNLIYDMDAESDPELALAIKMSQESIQAEVITHVDAFAHNNSPNKNDEKSVTAIQYVSVENTDHNINKNDNINNNNNNSAHFAPYECLTVRFLYELTMDCRMQLIVENWRKSEQYILLLLEISKLSWAARDFLVKRQVIAQMIDIFLVEQSPLNGVVYEKNTRKTVPSSYVPVGVMKDGSFSYSARNIPDWTNLVKLISLLVCNSKNEYQLKEVNNNNNSNNLSIFSLLKRYNSGNDSSSSMNNAVEDNYKSSIMNEWDVQCVTSKIFYSTLLKQSRYIKPTAAMIRHLCYENISFSNMIAEALFDEMQLTTVEYTFHLFEAIEAFCSIFDSNLQLRVSALFSLGNTNLLAYVSSLTEDHLKQKFVCVFIRSFIALVKKVPNISNQITNPQQKLFSWAPWMLKFSYRYQTKLAVTSNDNNNTQSSHLIATQNQIHQQILASNGTLSPSQIAATNSIISSANGGNNNNKDNDFIKGYSPPRADVVIGPQLPSAIAVEQPTPTSSNNVLEIDLTNIEKGPFFMIYGEDDTERESTWRARACKTFEELNSFLVSIGANPDSLIPDDTFITNDNNNNNINTDNIAVAAAAAAGNVAGDDGMAKESSQLDESLALYYQNMPDEID